LKSPSCTLALVLAAGICQSEPVRQARCAFTGRDVSRLPRLQIGLKRVQAEIRRELSSRPTPHPVRLPTGIILRARREAPTSCFFDRKPGRRNRGRRAVDLRSPHQPTFNPQENTSSAPTSTIREMLQSEEPAHPRRRTTGSSLHLRRPLKRDKVNLDIFWLKDESLEDYGQTLPCPTRHSQESSLTTLESALEQIAEIADELGRSSAKRNRIRFFLTKTQLRQNRANCATICFCLRHFSYIYPTRSPSRWNQPVLITGARVKSKHNLGDGRMRLGLEPRCFTHRLDPNESRPTNKAHKKMSRIGPRLVRKLAQLSMGRSDETRNNART